MKTIQNAILFSFLGQMLPAFIRAWAYDARYNAWANDPKFGDLAQASQAPGFDYASWTRQRATERDAIVLSRSQFNAKHNRAV